MAKKILKRSEVDPSLTWDLSALFVDEASFETSFERVLPLAEAIHTNFKGKLVDAISINACVDALKEISAVMTLV